MSETSAWQRMAALGPTKAAHMSALLENSSAQLRGEPIAVVGMGCRLPGQVRGTAAFGQLLADQVVPIGPVDPDRWFGDPSGIEGGFLEDPFGFDAAFFGMTPREAESLDPQQRLVLEVAVEALEDTGRPLEDVRGSRTGVFLGIYHHDFEDALPDEPLAHAATGNAHSVAAGRLAYAFDLTGPAVSFDTACSSSLVAMHQACRSLSARECDGAIVAGVNLMMSARTHAALNAWGMLSPRSRCSAFDAAADGFVRGEGVGAVVLKRLVDALEDGEHVLAVIRGSAVNQDGRSQGLTAPHGPSQEIVIRQALANAGVGAGSVGYIETHGTGTALGDPIEFEALHHTYGVAHGPRPCVLGAVKANVGHMEAAAGVIGVIKAVLVLSGETIPANPGFVTLNPQIQVGRTRLVVPAVPQAWRAEDGPRRAAVSSFGFGGTNAHLILEEGSPQALWPRPHPRAWRHEHHLPPGLGAQSRVPGDWFLVPTLRASAVEAAREAHPLGPVHVLSASGHRAEKLAGELRSLGVSATSGTLGEGTAGPGVVVLTPEPKAEPTAEHLHAEGMDLVRAALAAAAVPSTRIVLATIAGHPGVGGDVNPAEAAWWGWARGLALELDGAFAGAVDAPSLSELAEGVLTHVRMPDDDLFSVFRQGERLVPRLVRAPGLADSGSIWSPTANRSYLVIGANGALGMAVAQHVADRGARHLTLTGRGLPHDDVREKMERLAAIGVDVRWEQADAASAVEMRTLLGRFGVDRPSLDGLFLASFAGGPVSLADMSLDAVDAMFSAKVDAAMIADQLTRELDLSLFVLFSSTTSLLGSRQLAHYAAASAFLDGLAHRRRARGLPALAINWGIWASRLGETDDSAKRYVHESGLRPMDDRLALRALSCLLPDPETPQVMVADADWVIVRDAYSTRGPFTILEEVTASIDDLAPSMMADYLRALPPSERLVETVEHVRRLVADVMHLADPQRLDVGAGLFDVGVDSLMSLQIQRVLRRDFGLELPPTVVFSHPTVERIAQHVLVELELGDELGPVLVRGVAPRQSEPVAVVGLACRFPGGASVDEFWETLRSGRDAVVQVPEGRWDAAAYAGEDHSMPGTIITPLGGFLTDWDPARFDADFFGISPREAAAMDPQQRLILELAVEALNDAGLERDGLANTRTGVFIGLTTHDYMVAENRTATLEGLDAYSTTGNAANFAAGRVSYHLGLNGPAMAVDTACSSSLTALHLALGQIRAGDCDAALVGGVNLMLAPETSISFTRWGMLSPSGHCRSFDEAADGFVRGEGGGMVLLKPLSDARRDQDRVLAVILGSACGQDGTSAGQVVPNGQAQAAVIDAALRRSGLGANDIDFVETHGAGTAVGDPIELEALASVFGDRIEPIVLGALKSVVGHMEAAAGIGGLIKSVLALTHREIPANLHFETLTSRISDRASRVVVPRDLTPWPDTGRPARAGVSSFGASGTNVHVILEEAPASPDTRRTVWLYSGQGSQWEGMATDLLASDAAFAAAIAELAPLFERETGHALLPLLAGADIDDIALVQPSLFVMQIALSRSWAALGAEPAAVIGHSMGEVAAAVVAGALTLDDGMRVIARRSRLLSSIAGRGAMAVIEADEATAERLTETRSDIDIAVIASPTQIVVAGATEAIHAVVAEFERAGLFARLIKVDVASHSAQVEPLLPALMEALGELVPREPSVPFLSTVRDTPTFDAEYWADNLRRPVRFMDAVRRAMQSGAETFIEMAPHPLLSASVRDSAQGHDVTFVPSMRRGDPSVRPSIRRMRAPVRWDRRRHWFDETPSPSSDQVLLGSHAVTPSGAHVFTARDLLSTAPWLSGHRVDGVVVMPLAGWVSLIVEAMGRVLGREATVEIDDLVLHGLMPVVEGAVLSSILEAIDADQWRVKIGSWSAGKWQLHASALVGEGQSGDVLIPHPQPEDAEDGAHVDRLYAKLKGVGQQHLDAFRAVRAVLPVRPGEAVALLRVSGRAGAARSLRVFPPLLDGALQTLAAAAPDVWRGFVLPRRVDHIRVVGRFGDNATALATLTVGEGQCLGACSLTSAEARLDLEGIELMALEQEDAVRSVPMFTAAWQVLPAAGETDTPRPPAAALALGSPGALGAARLGAALGCQVLTRVEHLAAIAPLSVVCSVVEAPEHVTAGDLQQAVTGLRDVAATLLGLGLRDTPRLYCVVQVAYTTRPEPHPLADALRAVCRVLTYEHPDLQATVVVHDGCHASVADEVRAQDAETDLALLGGQRWVARLVPLNPEPRPLVVDVPAWFPMRAHALDGEVALIEEVQAELGEHEVLVQVGAAGLNFSDVLKARGAYAFHPGEPRTIGGEVAGVVVAVAPSSALKIGDHVFGFADGALGTRVVAREELLRLIPAGLGMSQAAALPVVWATAIHGLTRLARLRRGQTVLIHTASGGVGLAALSIARRLGARVIATAGTEEKRDFLRSLGVDEVCDSRDLSFAQGLARDGVDVVLNTLGGRAMERSLALLNPGGTFVELSKEATFAHQSVDLSALARGASFCTVDLAHVLRHDLATASALMDDVVDSVERGWVQMPPIRAHGLDRLDDALADFARPDHLGKIVVVPSDEGALRARPPEGRIVRPSGSYIITGAFSGLGWATTMWLAGQHPGCLVLNGRRPPAEEHASVLAAWRASGIRVEVVLGDIASDKVVQDLVAAATGPHQRIRGVVHSAGVVRDQTLLRMDQESLAEVLAPKVTGTEALLLALERADLDFCVLYSSAASLLGSPGQGAYSAANAAMDASARRFRRAGHPTLAINWGPWGETGLATGFSTLGYHVLSTADALAALERLVRSQAPQAGVFDVDRRQWFQSHPSVSALPYFGLLGADAPAEGRAGLPGFATDEDRRAFVEEKVLDQVSFVLRRERDRIDVEAPFASLGLDSLMALELRNRLERSIAIKLPVTVIWASPTVRELVDSIVQLLKPHHETEEGLQCEEEAASLSDEDQSLLDALGAALSEKGTPPQ